MTNTCQENVSQHLVQGCVSIWSKHVAQHNWTRYWRNFLVNLMYICFILRKISFSLQKEDFWGMFGPDFGSKKANLGPDIDSTACNRRKRLDVKGGIIWPVTRTHARTFVGTKSKCMHMHASAQAWPRHTLSLLKRNLEKPTYYSKHAFRGLPNLAVLLVSGVVSVCWRTNRARLCATLSMLVRACACHVFACVSACVHFLRACGCASRGLFQRQDPAMLGKYLVILVTAQLLRNAHLFIILFVRNFWRVCSRFWLGVRNSVWGPSF